VHGTALRVRLADGRTLGPHDLVGAALEAADEAGRPLTVRVDAVTPDPRDPEGEVLLYRMTALGADGAWRELCGPDPAGERWAGPARTTALDQAVPRAARRDPPARWPPRRGGAGLHDVAVQASWTDAVVGGRRAGRPAVDPLPYAS
jgi:hypothetical protein